jgi:hypothetical protein
MDGRIEEFGILCRIALKTRRTIVEREDLFSTSLDDDGRD